MNQELQQEFKSVLVKDYKKYAYEQLALYTYWGDKFKAIKAQVDDYEGRIKKAEDKVKEISAITPRTFELKEQLKAQHKDIDSYKKIVENAKAPYNELQKKCVGYQQRAVEALEQAKCIDEFVLKTPEEIAADKAKVESPAETPVVADGKTE